MQDTLNVGLIGLGFTKPLQTIEAGVGIAEKTTDVVGKALKPLKPLKPYAEISAVNVGIGGAIRTLQGEEKPWAPEKVATDVALGLAFGGALKGLSFMDDFATGSVSNVISKAGKFGTAAGITDLAEDYLRPAIYKGFGKVVKKGDKKITIPDIKFENGKIKFEQPEGTEAPKPDLSTLPWSIGIGAAIGTGIGLLENYAQTHAITIPKIGKAELPGGKKWYGLYLEKGTKAKPLIGISKEDYTFNVGVGQPQFKTKLDLSTLSRWGEEGSYQPTSAIERSIFLKQLEQNNVLPSQEMGKFKILDVADKTYYVKAPTPMKEDFYNALKQSDRLKDVADDLLNYLQNKRNIFGVIRAKAYGSTVQKAYMGSEMSRQPADLDLAVKNPEKTAKELVKILSKKAKVRINPQHPTLIERQINGQWVHLIDIHDYGSSGLFSFSSDQEQIGWGYQPKRSEWIKLDKGKLEIMPLSEQGSRKVSSSLTVWQDKVAPQQHRIKDIIDAYQTQKFLARYLPPSEQQQALQMLEQWKGYWYDIINPEAFHNGAQQLTAMFLNSVPYQSLPVYPAFTGLLPGLAGIFSQAKSVPESEEPIQSKGIENIKPSPAPSIGYGESSSAGISEGIGGSEGSKGIDEGSSKPPSGGNDKGGGEGSEPPSKEEEYYIPSLPSIYINPYYYLNMIYYSIPNIPVKKPAPPKTTSKGGVVYMPKISIPRREQANAQLETEWKSEFEL